MNENGQGHLAEGWIPNYTPPSAPNMAAAPASAQQPYGKGEAVLTNGMNHAMETANQNHADVAQTPESDAEDEEVRSLDLPAQVGIDLRNKTGLERLCPEGVSDRDRERPMSWEGELSDQEIHSVEPPRLKAEPAAEEDTAMEGVQSVGPSSPQPMYIVPEVPASAVNVKSERPWESTLPPPLKSHEILEQQRTRRSPPLALTQRPGFETLTGHTPVASPLTSRHPIRLPLSASGLPHPPTPSPDSAIHSAYYSPTASPGQSRHRNGSGLSSPYSHRASPSLSRNNSDASQYSQFGGSQYSYSSAPSPLSPSPAQSPVQPRHMAMLAATAGGFPSPVLTRPGHGLGALGEFPPSPLLYRHGHISQFPVATPAGSLPGVRDLEIKTEGAASLAPPSIDSIEDNTRDAMEDKSLNPADLAQHTALAAQAGISRQQLINSPCPICGDKISGFHYGIFSCESCKGFFKRTVQNKKNYVCLRGASCPVTIATRKKCPACRFEKCLNTGMKLEAIREDRTRGGRSTYQCTYALPAGVLASGPEGPKPAGGTSNIESGSSRSMDSDWSTPSSSQDERQSVPQLLLEIMNVEHFWHCTEQDQQHRKSHFSAPHFNGQNGAPAEDYSSMCSIADHRLYKIVKWCKSLPLFKSIHIDDQISLLINTWCELLLLACCYRSMATPGEIRISQGKSITVDQSRALGLGPCIERMVNFTDHLRRLRVDQYEYAALKVIILLSSDTSGLKEQESVRASQESVLQALQQYTLSHYPDIPSKFGELLLRITELERTCQVVREMLTMRREGDGQGFNLLMELLRGDH